MVPSKSTDKLEVICGTICEKILSDAVLKDRVKSINIDWEEVGDDMEPVVVPKLAIQFFE